MQLGSTSAIRCLERGCPQGSVSGPIFWNIIINDLLSKLNNLACCEIIAFADDILVCSQGRDISATFLHTQEALNFASDWSKSFKLDFNPDKTRFMAIEKRNVCYDAFQLYLNGTPLTMVKQMKYLGVLIDTEFSWKQHLSYISEKCVKLQRGLNRIARNTFRINFNVHSLIYKQGIKPFILYGSRVWGEALKKKMNYFAFVRGHKGALGNERADWLAKAATKRKINIDVNIPKSFYKITKERMVKSWNQESHF
ncbi:uncharacterized protein TNCV_1008701 [Trichonephila clavipes]|nr:uncharacterized protein TNCV_1008701 [Trichonephila clavipes]